MLLSTGSGTIFEKMNEMTRTLDDAKTSTDLKLSEKLSRKINEIEDSLKKYVNRDVQRLNQELINMNGTVQKMCTD